MKTVIAFNENGNYKTSAGEFCHVLSVHNSTKVASKTAVIFKELGKTALLKKYDLKKRNNR